MWETPSSTLWLFLTLCLLTLLEPLYKPPWHPHKSKWDWVLTQYHFKTPWKVLSTWLFVCVSRQCVPCTLDDVLGPSNIPEARNDEKALIEQLVNFLSGTDESELAELDKALGIDKLVQVSREKCVENVNLTPLRCTITQRMIIQLKQKTKKTLIFLYHISYQSGCFDPLGQSFPTQQPTVSPVPMDPKLPSYPTQFTPASQAQLPPELATVGPQGQGFGAPQAAFPVGTTGIGLRPGVMRPQGPQIRLSPNQLRLQLQQRLQGPQQVRTCLCSGGRCVFVLFSLCVLLLQNTLSLWLLSKIIQLLLTNLHLFICSPPLFSFFPSLSAPEQVGWCQSVSRSGSACEHRDSSGSSATSGIHASESYVRSMRTLAINWYFSTESTRLFGPSHLYCISVYSSYT